MAAPRLTGSRCLCRTCGEYFNSTGMFDRHRIGTCPDRRCMTAAELLKRGYSRNAGGFWIRAGRWQETRRNDDRPEAAQVRWLGELAQRGPLPAALRTAHGG